jgi:hypothetical protein
MILKKSLLELKDQTQLIIEIKKNRIYSTLFMKPMDKN